MSLKKPPVIVFSSEKKSVEIPMILVRGFLGVLDDPEMKPMSEGCGSSSGIPQDGVSGFIKSKVSASPRVHLVRVERAPLGRIGVSPDVMKLNVVSPVETKPETTFSSIGITSISLS